MADTAKVYLVGAGLGDPDLLTRKAERILRTAVAVIHDPSVSAEILALANPEAILLSVSAGAVRQDDTQAEVYGWFLRFRGARGPLVRLKSGDPMIFGRGGEEIEFLTRHGFDVEIVPGISSATAAPTLAGIPLTQRGVAEHFTVVAGHRESLESIDWLVCRHIDTLVFLMGVENRARIAASLISAGRHADEPVAFLEKSSTPQERVIESTLGEVARGRTKVEAPAVFVIGEVVRLRRSHELRSQPEVVVNHVNSKMGRMATASRNTFDSAEQESGVRTLEVVGR